MAKYYYDVYNLKWPDDKTYIDEGWPSYSAGQAYYNEVFPNGAMTSSRTHGYYLSAGKMYVENRFFDLVRQNPTAEGGFRYRSSNSITTYRIYTSLQNLLKIRVKDGLLETVILDDSDYPIDGIQGNRWYVRREKAMPTIQVKQNGRLLQVANAQVNGRGIANILVKDQSGTIRKVK